MAMNAEEAIPEALQPLVQTIESYRPKSMHRFAILWLQDRQKGSLGPILQTLHVLPYLLHKPHEFREFCGKIFCDLPTIETMKAANDSRGDLEATAVAG